ncbi:MAG: hypothetical protein KHZ05_05325 [Oscillospiraceae bacterium]|nr:hypothetical protein [Oscillospiraceae bacterium]
MIKIISGVYGHYVTDPKSGKSRVVARDRRSEPFELEPEQEARLVSQGVARYVNKVEIDAAPIGFDEQPPDPNELPEGVVGIPEYSEDMTVKELRDIGKLCGLTFKVGMTKKEMVDALDAEIEGKMVDYDEVVNGESDDEDAPSFDAAEAVQ